MAGPHRQHGKPPPGASARYAAHITGSPIVSTVDQAGAMLGVDPGRLAQAVATAGLAEWGRHHCGEAVFRWGELVELAQHLGAMVPGYPNAQRLRAKQDRGRANRYRKRQP